jgi:SAM-dependent methyltransferase
MKSLIHFLSNLILNLRLATRPLRIFLHSHGSAWLSFNGWYRRNLVECPIGSTNSSARDAWVGSQLTRLPKGWRILDAGSGEQKYRPLCKHLKYVSQDHEAYDGHGDGVGGHVPSWTYGETNLVCDITEIPEPDASFDAVLCTEVLEHVPDPVCALEELARLLKPGGTVILSVPFCSFTHFAPYHFSTGLSRYWYEQHLGRLGFEQVTCEANGNYFEYLAQEIRRLEQMAKDYAGTELSWAIKFLSIMMLRFLSKLSAKDTGSWEYASFGWHVSAVKSKKPLDSIAKH